MISGLKTIAAATLATTILLGSSLVYTSTATSPKIGSSYGKAELPDTSNVAPIAYARMETSMGTLDIKLNGEKAPYTVANFIAYAEKGYYMRLIMHRVIPNKLVQGGGYNQYLFGRSPFPPIPNEATNGLKNLRGTIAMARQQDPHSADSQFFINLKDNPELDHQGTEYILDWGYAVFGEVVRGMNIADAMSQVPTHSQEQFDQDLPVENIIIKDVIIISAEDYALLEDTLHD